MSYDDCDGCRSSEDEIIDLKRELRSLQSAEEAAHRVLMLEMERRAGEAQNEIDDLKYDLQRAKNDRDDAANERDEMSGKLDDLRNELSDCERDRDRFEQQRDEVQRSLDDLRYVR
jgi:chromosome segregation ATPase